MRINAKISIKIFNIHAILRYLRLLVNQTQLDYVYLMVNVKFLTIKIINVRITISLLVNNHRHNVCSGMELASWI